MEPRLAEIESKPFTAPAARGPRAAGRAPMTRSNFAFVNYAVEIEGDAPLIALAEAVDD